MIIELPDGRELDAPDDATPDQIRAIVRKHSGSPAGWKPKSWAPSTFQPDEGGASAPLAMAPSHATIPPPRPLDPREVAAREEPGGFGRAVARGGWAIPGLLGLDYEAAQGVEWAVRDPMNLADRGMSLTDRFRFYRDLERERSQRAEQAHPILTGLGIGAGSAPSMLLMPTAKAAEGAGLGARALTSALTAGAQSAAIEGGVTGALPPEERIKRMGVAGAAGMALGSLAPIPSHVPTQGQIDAAAGIPKGVSPEAARLMEEGVPLTPGQRNPAGRWAQLEEASTSMPIVGPKITEARNAAREAWGAKAFEKARAPGAPVPEGATPGEMVSSLRGGFNEAYGAVKGAMAPESVSALPEAFALAAKRPDVLATDATRGEVGRFLKNQLSLLDRESPTVEKLITIRSNIRAAARAGNTEARPLLRDAEQAVTEAITKGAPPEAADLLRQIDRQYPAYKTVSKASGLAKDQTSGLTPTHLSSAVEATTPPAVYEQGGGGPLREWAAAGKEAFDTRVPMTGARLLTMTPGLRYGVGAAAYLRAARLPQTVEKLMAALRANPEQFGVNAPGLLSAAARGPGALAAAHYVLSSSSPEYRARWEADRVADEEQERSGD